MTARTAHRTRRTELLRLIFIVVPIKAKRRETYASYPRYNGGSLHIVRENILPPYFFLNAKYLTGTVCFTKRSALVYLCFDFLARMRRTENAPGGLQWQLTRLRRNSAAINKQMPLVVLLVFPLLTAYFTPNGRSQPPNGLGQKGRGILSQLVEALHILGQNTPSLLSQSPPHARGKAGASVRMERPHGRKRRQEGHFSPETGTVGTDAPLFRRATDS